jgi:hypothetical protein
VPARRGGEALERLVALYRGDAREGETAKEFFRRVELERVKAVLADLEAAEPAPDRRAPARISDHLYSRRSLESDSLASLRHDPRIN